ncbi:hypothetical protein ACKKBG_A37145 [Auxenochlorella protothecoides x Auxenochlorella symbiontica]
MASMGSSTDATLISGRISTPRCVLLLMPEHPAHAGFRRCPCLGPRSRFHGCSLPCTLPPCTYPTSDTQFTMDPILILPAALIEQLVTSLTSLHDVAAARLVSHAWRAAVSSAVQDLRPVAGADVARLPVAFPWTASLTLTARPACLPHLGNLGRLLALRTLCLVSTRNRQRLDCAVLLPLADSLRELTLSHFQLAGCASLSHFSRMRYLSVGRCGFDPGDGAARASEALLRLPRLRSLEAPLHEVGPDLASLPRLTALTLTEVPHGELQGAAWLGALPDLDSLSLVLESDLAAVSWRDWLDGFLARLVVGMPRLQHLTILGLAGISEAGMASLGQMAALRELHLDVEPTLHNLLGKRHSPLQSLGSLRQLRTLSLSHVDFLRCGSGALSTLPALRCLTLRDPACLDDGVAHALRFLPHLAELCITDCSCLTDWGMHALLSSLPRLQTLSLRSGCSRISDVGFQKLGTLTHLESLSLTGFAKVSDDGIAGQLMSTKTLRQADFFDMNVGDISCRALATSARGLEKAKLQYCWNLTCRGVDALLEIPDLRSLMLHGSEAVGRGMHAIQSARFATVLSDTRVPPWWVGSSG